MRPIRSIWSFFRSAQVTCSVHGARAAADLMRGSMSTVCALFEFIPLLQQPLTICQYPRQCFTAVARRDCFSKYFGIGDADLGLKVGADNVNMRRIMIRRIQGDLSMRRNP